MSAEMAPGADLIATLRDYQELCNRFDMEAAMAYFTEESTIKIDGREHRGMAEMIRIHEGDRGCRLLVDFTDFEAHGDTLGCYFHAESEVDRALGLGGVARWNRITFRDGKIVFWDIDAPPAEELQRRRPQMKAFLDWAKENHPELLARAGSGYNFETASAYAELGVLWVQSKA